MNDNDLRACIANYYELKQLEDCSWTELMKRGGTCIPGTDTEVAALQMADLLSG